MTKRVIVLGNANRVGLGAYVAGMRACKASAPGTEYKHGLRGWGPETRETILRDFEASVHDRINRHVPGYGKGRKWDPDWFWATARAARALNTPRLIVRRATLPVWLRHLAREEE